MTHYESGGQFWHLTFDRICASLGIGNFLLGIVMAYKGSTAHFVALLPLPIIVCQFNFSAYKKYYLPSKERALSDIVEDDKFLDLVKERWDWRIEDRLNRYFYLQPSLSVYHDVIKSQKQISPNIGSDEEIELTTKKMEQRRLQEMLTKFYSRITWQSCGWDCPGSFR